MNFECFFPNFITYSRFFFQKQYFQNKVRKKLNDSYGFWKTNKSIPFILECINAY